MKKFHLRLLLAALFKFSVFSDCRFTFTWTADRHLLAKKSKIFCRRKESRLVEQRPTTQRATGNVNALMGLYGNQSPLLQHRKSRICQQKNGRQSCPMLYIQYEVFCAHQLTERLMKDFFYFTRKSTNGQGLPCWLVHSEKALPKRFITKSEYDPLVDKIELIDVNTSYAPIRHTDGREDSFNETSSSTEGKYPT